MAYNYKMVKIVCRGTIKSCSRCAETGFMEGYCPQCGRPLWKNPGDPCRFILGYVERTNDQKQGNNLCGGKVNFKCTMCNTVTTI